MRRKHDILLVKHYYFDIVLLNPRISGENSENDKQKCISVDFFRACLHGGPYSLLFYLDHLYMIVGLTRLDGLPGLLGRVTLSAGVTSCHVNVSR